VIGWIHHATVRVADVAEARERWSRLLGLTGEADGERALLRCGYEDFCLELRPVGDGEAPGVEHVGYELQAGLSLDDARSRLSSAGVAFEQADVPMRGTGLRLADPDGNGIVVLERRVFSDPQERWPPVARFTDVLPAFHPRKFGHVNYLTADTKAIVDWYVEVLGFEVTDWIGDEACWLHVNSDHHVLAFLDKGYAHIHHLAFELVDWGEMRVVLDHLAQHRRPITWGPGRHAMAQNLFAYFRMVEEEHFVELFTDLEQLESDHVVRHFPDDPHASNAWGILPPRSYFRFDREAIESELGQHAALGMPEPGAAG
jgi:catechol 2,3-dioxygenase-like lactoylglutathione lyase family enzyme